MSSRVRIDEPSVDRIFAHLDGSHGPGAAVGIAIGGRPVYRKAFGLASMELPVALSPGTRLRIGSTTKHFAALAYLLLCEEGRAQLDDTVGKLLPELHPATHAVTVRQLMGNISGLRDVFDICWQFHGTGQPVSSADLLSLYRDIDDVNAAPGVTWMYNNGGWLMLSAAIERITDRSLEEVLQQRIFAAVGMNDTLLRRMDSDFVPNSATLHTRGLNGQFEKRYLGTALAGEGGMVSTVDDMLRWLAHMDQPVVGRPDTWRAMRAPQVLTNGASTGYGLGLMAVRYRGIDTLQHGGGVMGGNSQMLKVPSVALDLAIMINRDDVAAAVLGNQILDACLSDLEPSLPAVPDRIERAVFVSSATGRVIQLLAEGSQQIACIDGLDVPVAFGQDGVLWPGGIWGFIQQRITVRGDPKSPTSILLDDFGDRQELQRVRPLDARRAETVAGRYRAGALGVCATIIDTDKGPILRTMGRFGSAELDLQSLAKGVWRARPRTAHFPPGGVLVFDDQADGFRFSSFRTRSLPFARVA